MRQFATNTSGRLPYSSCISTVYWQITPPAAMSCRNASYSGHEQQGDSRCDGVPSSHSRHLRHWFSCGAAQRAGAQSDTTRPHPHAVTFARDIQPILEKSCASCHSGDLKLADLDLSNREAAMRGGEHGAVIVAGNAEKSKLYRMVAGLDQPVMPMEGDRAEAGRSGGHQGVDRPGRKLGIGRQLRQGHPADHGAVVLELPRRSRCSSPSWISARVKARSAAARMGRR